ncbi:MAG TPA: SBBP repeat-containing protein [Pyrinomonadaceae bacterium]|nr:SBBP repeat-containing protein [Pyrinomonadaceae bacterium]
MKSCPANVKLSLSLLLVLSCLLNLPSAPAEGVNNVTRATNTRPQASAPAPNPAPAMPLAEETAARETYGKLELHFEANQGQTDASVNFLARGAGYALFLKPAEVVFRLRSASEGAHGDTARESFVKAGDTRAAKGVQPSSVLRMKLVGADEGAHAEGLGELAGKVNYFSGNDPAKWRANVPTFGRVRYSEVYPGIDVVYYGNQRQLEYDFVVAPGADARAVSLKFVGADKVAVDEGGDLLLTVDGDIIRQLKPVVYQEEAASGERRTIESGYALQPDGRVGFHLGDYDAERPLVIDPVIAYSTYLGGSGTDEGRDIAVDAAGNAYVCGETDSANFPTANAFDSTFGSGQLGGQRDAFVTKLNAAGNALVYSTYLGGSGNTAQPNINGDDRCFGIRVDASGNAYVAGETHSDDFPTANAFQATYGGGFSDAFVTKLNAAGNALVYSTYLGGNIFDAAQSIALDSSNNVYVTGRTTSPNFPTANALQATQASQFADAFVTKINAEGTALVYSTYLGGSASTSGQGDFENGSGIAVDSAGNAYVTGQTRSTNFPTLNPVQAAFGGGFPNGDAFVTKINPGGTALVFSTYLGGSNDDVGADIAVDSAGVAHVAGFTESANFPTANALDAAFGGTLDGFVTKFNPAGTAFAYSTYLGGSGEDAANDIAVDAAGNVHVAGGTASTDFPTLNPVQAALVGVGDTFVSKLNPGGTAFIYSTYFGGGGIDRANSFTLDSTANAYVTGITDSTNFPTLTPAQATNGGGLDAFVYKLSDQPAEPTPAVVQFAQATYTVAEGAERNTDPASLTVTVSRTVNTSGETTVEYRTIDLSAEVRCDTANGMAYHRCDYATTLGTLTFAAGETQKTFSVFITDDAHVEGNETFQIALANATGGGIGTQMTTTVTIQDNDTQAAVPNPIDTSEFFIRQHYIDFLMRAPEAMGFSQWVAALNNCGAGSGDRGRNPACDRVMVSSGFFRSDEYLQVKGYFAYRFYEVAFDRRPTYVEFARDLQRLTGTTSQDTLARMDAFTTEFTQRPEFTATYPNEIPLNAYVDILFTKAEIGDRQSITRQDNTTLTRAQLADGSRTRAAILREIVESREVAAIFYNRAFVAAQYFGYLRRDPESPGYEMWLTYLNANPNDFRTMVSGFVNSVEYRLRFGRP